MPRGRHRHSPPLHRLLPPSAIAGVSLVCALGPWVFTEPSVLRVSAAVAAATAAVGAAVMRRWDVEAGKRVADLTRARASDEWRHEEQVAELETDLEESRELRQKLEHKLRAKRTELAGLRNEHAALLRRYATAETERASALEGRRRLAIEASASPAPASAKALTAGSGSASEDVRGRRADEDTAEKAAEDLVASGAAAEDADGADGAVDDKAAETRPSAPGAFSAAGTSLFLRANSALDRLVQAGSPKAANDEKTRPAADSAPKGESRKDESRKDDSAKGGSPEGGSPRSGAAEAEAAPAADAAEEDDHPEAQSQPETAEGQDHEPVVTETEAPEPETAETQNEAEAEADVTESAAPESAITDPASGLPANAPAQRPALAAQLSGHFTVPTAVAVAPATPRRRLAIEGGFDFFGTQKGAAAIAAVQNEDLADVVGQEALALHKAESEAQFKPADAESRGIGQVIDLTAHDETEQIDVEGLRSAAS
ncbi:hypothetical protein [Streptomyces sp. NPDC046862]|uniref:hypothetical protein n=1 Tax=Streptomyces sp. NPDC046862 TaxID=3154603 RepID=UPI00345221E8